MDKYYRKRLVPLLLPAMILFIMVILIPFGIGVIYSFCGWRGTYFAGGDHFYDAFVGFQNYIKVFKSSKFRDSFVYTLEFTVVAVIALNIVSLIMALLATSVHKGAGAYRTIYFMPNLLGGLALGYIWQFIFEIVFSQLIFNKDGIINIPFFCNTGNPCYLADGRIHDADLYDRSEQHSDRSLRGGCYRRCKRIPEIPLYHDPDADAVLHHRIFPDSVQMLHVAGPQRSPDRW